jgi:hypothetical protein
MQAGMRELLSQLDGSRASRIAMLADMTRRELDAVGGVESTGTERARPACSEYAHLIIHAAAVATG